jgi:protein-tyrosine-phosphatase
VVFVCTANSARSQLAAALWARVSDIPAASAGTAAAARVAPGAVAAAQRHHLTLADTKPRNLDEVVRPGDYLVTVCDKAHESLSTVTLHWSVPDPVAEDTRTSFDATVAELTQRVDLLAHHLAAS